MTYREMESHFGIFDVLAIIAESWYILIGLPAFVGLLTWLTVVSAPPTFKAVATVDWVNDAPELVRSTRFERAMLDLPGFSTIQVSDFNAENDIPNRKTRVIFKAFDRDEAENAVLQASGVLRKIGHENLEPELDATLASINRQIGVLQSSLKILSADANLDQSKQTDRSEVSGDARAAVVAGVVDLLNGKVAERDQLLQTIDLLNETKSELPIVEIEQIKYDMRVVVAASLVASIAAAVISYLRYAIPKEREWRKSRGLEDISRPAAGRFD